MTSISPRLGGWGRPLWFVLLVAAAFLLRSPVGWLGSRLADLTGSGANHFITLSPLRHVPALHYLHQNWPDFTRYFGDHFRYTILGITIATAIALPVGILVSRVSWLSFPVFTVLDITYTLPSLILFVLLLQFTGLTDTTVLIVVVAYAQFILVRNVVVGLASVPAEVKEAARGMGMSGWQSLLRVELPLALPIIITGIRIATVAIIAIVAVSAAIAMESLGTPFFTAVFNGGVNANVEIEAAAIMVTALALGADTLLRIATALVPATHATRRSRLGWRFRR